MKRRWLWIGAVLLGLAGAILLAYLLIDLVRLLLLDPLAYLYRLGSLLYRLLPQTVWWGGFVRLLAFWFSRSLFGPQAGARLLERLRRSPPPQTAPDRLSRAGEWLHLAQRAHRSQYARWQFNRRLSILAVEMLAYRQRLSIEEAQAHLLSGKLHLPPDLQAYFQVGLQSPSFLHYENFVKRYRQRAGSSPLDLSPEAVVEYLEVMSDEY